jgi:hypothetical protein
MAILYLIYNPILKAFKIGVGDLVGNRYSEHRRNGWVLVKYWYFKDRKQAFKVEKVVLQTLKKKFISGFVTKDMMPQGGFTETFDASQTSSTKIIRVINKSISKKGFVMSWGPQTSYHKTFLLSNLQTSYPNSGLYPQTTYLSNLLCTKFCTKMYKKCTKIQQKGLKGL